MFLSAAYPNHVSEECFRSLIHENVFKATEVLLTPRADVVAEPHIVADVTEGSRQIVFLWMQGLAAVAETGRLRVDASAGFSLLGVHSGILQPPQRTLAEPLSGSRMPVFSTGKPEKGRDQAPLLVLTKRCPRYVAR